MAETELQTMNSEGLLINEDTYLTAGVQIGTQQKSKDMLPFIYKVRSDGLYILNVQKTDERIRGAAKFIARFEPNQVLVTSARQYGQKPARLFAKHTGTRSIAGRFVPGSLTNPQLPSFYEPDVILVTDPTADAQALKEAVNIGIPVVGLCDANNEHKYVDYVIPCNNKGRRALAIVYWLLAREVCKARGLIKEDTEWTATVDEFEATL